MRSNSRPRSASFFTVSASLAALATVAACGDDDGTGPAAPPSVTITTADPTLNAIGDTLRLEVEVRDADGGVQPGIAVTWTALDQSVATVGEEGEVVAVGVGTARVVAAVAAGAADTAAVEVRQVAASLELTVPDDTLAEGEAVQLVAAVADSNGMEIADPRSSGRAPTRRSPAWTRTARSRAAAAMRPSS